VELLQTQLIPERVTGDTRPTSGTGFRGDRLAAVDARKGADSFLHCGSFGTRLWFPVHDLKGDVAVKVNLKSLPVMLLLLVGVRDAVVRVDFGKEGLHLFGVGVELPVARPVRERVDEFLGANGSEVVNLSHGDSIARQQLTASLFFAFFL